MLYGPLAIVAWITWALQLRRWLARWPRRLAPDGPLTAEHVATLCCLVPVGLLSIVPHQEARFLVALVGPLALCLARSVHRASSSWARWFWPAWFLFNAFAGLIYGGLHQGGVFPVLDHFHRHLCRASPGRPPVVHIVFAHTYMPPEHLLPRHRDTLASVCDTSSTVIHLHDVAGIDAAGLEAYLAPLVRSGPEKAQVLLVSSGVAQLGALPLAQVRLVAAHDHPRITPHLSLEKAAGYLAWPMAPDAWSLVVHDVVPG